jgi:hypothetical protein
VNLKLKLPLLLIISIGFISGCSSTASLSAMKIKPAEQKTVEHCQYLGDVQGSSGFGGVAASQGMENSKIEAKEGAAKLGATHIVWSNIVGGYAPSAFGKAYKC